MVVEMWVQKRLKIDVESFQRSLLSRSLYQSSIRHARVFWKYGCLNGLENDLIRSLKYE